MFVVSTELKAGEDQGAAGQISPEPGWQRQEERRRGMRQSECLVLGLAASRTRTGDTPVQSSPVQSRSEKSASSSQGRPGQASRAAAAAAGPCPVVAAVRCLAGPEQWTQPVIESQADLGQGEGGREGENCLCLSCRRNQDTSGPTTPSLPPLQHLRCPSVFPVSPLFS